MVADSSRHLPGRSAGLGVGYLPVHRIKGLLASGDLVTLGLQKSENRTNNLTMGWRKDNQGKTLAWFVSNMRKCKRSYFNNLILLFVLNTKKLDYFHSLVFL